MDDFITGCVLNVSAEDLLSQVAFTVGAIRRAAGFPQRQFCSLLSAYNR